MRIKSIQLKKETKEKLAQLGNKKDTYDDIVRRLLSSQEAPLRPRGKTLTK